VSAQPAGRRLPAARRRTQLLDVALEVFGSRGYHATSMEDIAEAAGVTKPVVYQHFPSKVELYRELIGLVGEELRTAVTAAATAEPAPFARVLAGFRAYFRFVGERNAAFRLLFGGGAREADEFAEVVRRVEDSIATTIADLIEVDLGRPQRDLLGYAIVGLAEVTARQWVRREDEGGRGPDPDRLSGDELAAQLADLVWAGLRGLPAPAGRGRSEGRLAGHPPPSRG
jgi:AcrR family transcriptional regulator